MIHTYPVEFWNCCRWPLLLVQALQSIRRVRVITANLSRLTLSGNNGFKRSSEASLRKIFILKSSLGLAALIGTVSIAPYFHGCTYTLQFARVNLFRAFRREYIRAGFDFICELWWDGNCRQWVGGLDVFSAPAWTLPFLNLCREN